MRSVQSLLQFKQLYCYTQHTFVSSVLFLKFEAFTEVAILIRGGVPSVQSLLHFTQLYCYTQHTFISAVSFLTFDALTGVVTLVRGGGPPFKIFVLQLFNDKFLNLWQQSLIKGARQSFLNPQCSKAVTL